MTLTGPPTIRPARPEGVPAVVVVAPGSAGHEPTPTGSVATR